MSNEPGHDHSLDLIDEICGCCEDINTRMYILKARGFELPPETSAFFRFRAYWEELLGSNNAKHMAEQDEEILDALSGEAIFTVKYKGRKEGKA